MNKAAEKLAQTLLYFGFVVGAVAVYVSRYDSRRQFLIVLLLIAFYLIWGFSYHSGKKDLKKRVFLEYLVISLIALLAAVIVFAS